HRATLFGEFLDLRQRLGRHLALPAGVLRWNRLGRETGATAAPAAATLSPPSATTRRGRSPRRSGPSPGRHIRRRGLAPAPPPPPPAAARRVKAQAVSPPGQLPLPNRGGHPVLNGNLKFRKEPPPPPRRRPPAVGVNRADALFLRLRRRPRRWRARRR